MFFYTIDFSRISENKGTNLRLGWTKYSDLYEIVHPQPRPHFFMFAHWSVKRERFITNGFYTVSNVMMNFIHYQERLSVTFKKSRQTSVLAKSAYKICTCLYEC